MKIKILDDNVLNYEIIRKKVGRITIKVLPNLCVRVVVPMQMSNADIEKTVGRHLEWITERRRKIAHLYPELQKNRLFNDGEFYRFLGKEYRLRICTSQYRAVIIERDDLFIHVVFDDYESKKQAMDQWLIRQSTLVLNELFHEQFEAIQPTPIIPTLRLRTCKTIWGSCNFKKRTITLNRKLIHLPIDLIRYVIIHEFVHLRHPNHGKEFYSELERCVGDYKKMKQEMKKYSIYYV